MAVGDLIVISASIEIFGVSTLATFFWWCASSDVQEPLQLSFGKLAFTSLH